MSIAVAVQIRVPKTSYCSCAETVGHKHKTEGGNMTNKIILVLICLSCYSCATLVNNKQTQIEIHTIPESATICLDNDSCIK